MLDIVLSPPPWLSTCPEAGTAAVRRPPRDVDEFVTHEEELQRGRGELSDGRHRVYLATLERAPARMGV